MTEDQHKRKLEYNRKYGQGYRGKNRDHLREKKREWHQKNRAREREKKREYWKAHPNERMVYRRSSPRERFHSAKISARKRGLLFELTFEECAELFKGACAYCGEFGDESLNGIDRVDSSIGYLKDNVVSCCKTCNFMKSTHQVDFFLNHITKIYDFTNSSKMEK